MHVYTYVRTYILSHFKKQREDQSTAKTMLLENNVSATKIVVKKKKKKDTSNILESTDSHFALHENGKVVKLY